MLIYNLLIFTVAFLLYLDHLVDKNDVHLQNGGSRIYIGNTFMYMALFVIIFFAGFRFEIGYDYTKYLAGYMFDDELKHWEPFFNFFVRMSRHIDFGMGIQFMFLFFSTLTIFIVYMALKSLTPHYRLGLLFYLLIPALYLNSFSVVRQGIAIVILLYGLQYITTNVNYKKYMFIAFTAFMFHYGSLFVAVIFLLGAKFFQNVYSWVFYSFLIVSSFFLSFAHIGGMILSVMPGHFDAYAGYELGVSPLKLMVVNSFFLFFMVQKNIFIKSKLEKYLFNSLFIGLLIFNTFSDFVYVTRLAQYFLVAEIVLVPIYLYSIKGQLTKKIVFGLFLMYYLFNFNYALYRDEQFLHGKSNALVPYRDYFSEEHKLSRSINIEAWYHYIQEIKTGEEQQKDLK